MTGSTSETTASFPRYASAFVVVGSLLLSGCPQQEDTSRAVVPPAATADSGQPAGAASASPHPAADESASQAGGATGAPDGQPSDTAIQAEGAETGDGSEPESPYPSVKDHPGPWLWVKRASAGVYPEPRDSRKNKIGYVKRGGKLAILEQKVEGPGCPRGWYQLVTGGYVCSHVGTIDPNDPGARFAPHQPNVDEVLPYPYARNSKNGTPLYRSMPSREQMYEYEPYLPEAQKAREAAQEEREADEEQMREAGLGLGGAQAVDEEVPIWEREENLHEVTLEDLRKDSDEVLSARLMKGFYVAVDQTFKRKGRTWYKTTKGVITPADRYWQASASEFHGVEIDGKEWSLPIGFVTGARKSTATYEIDLDSKKRTPKGTVEKFKAVQLDYGYFRIGKLDYIQLADGTWIRDAHIRMTTPSPRPAEVGENERWIDVDISEQTLVVFQGDRPIYATLISSGKESRNPDKDHSTPRGMWRVREKHMASTMDGNGSAAGDMPYSIEDVPYIMYFHKSYATHGAFWHRNYGYQMSHGCVNLAPLDAKWVFFHADPPLPEGFHGAWASESRPGSWVVIHD